MIKKLKKVGNSGAIIIDKNILELLKLNDDTPLEITTNGDVLVITPIRDKKKQEKLQKNLDFINNEYGDILKKLAE